LPGVISQGYSAHLSLQLLSKFPTHLLPEKMARQRKTVTVRDGVLVSAGIELIFFSVAAVFWI